MAATKSIAKHRIQIVARTLETGNREQEAAWVKGLLERRPGRSHAHLDENREWTRWLMCQTEAYKIDAASMEDDEYQAQTPRITPEPTTAADAGQEPVTSPKPNNPNYEYLFDGDLYSAFYDDFLGVEDNRTNGANTRFPFEAYQEVVLMMREKKRKEAENTERNRGKGE